MAEIVNKIEELTRLDSELHWFCPRTHANHGAVAFDEDCLDVIPNESAKDKDRRMEAIKEAEERRDGVLFASRILAFDGTDALPYAKKLLEALQRQLTRCDICVRQYHRSRSLLAASLEAEFDAAEVKEFISKFDSMNVERISKGLNVMTESLIDLPPEQRNISSAGDEGMYAMFEALNCGPFLSDEQALAEHFDRPFKLVQSKRKLKLPSYAPGMAAFLFSTNPERSAWGIRNFTSVKRPLTAPEFEHAVKPFFERAMLRVNITSLEGEFLCTFWKGSRIILGKMTKDLIANHLRAMDSNLMLLALELFQIDDEHFAEMTASYQLLLEQSPHAFWDALGNITAQTVVETIFRSPVLDGDLQNTEEIKPLNLEDKLGWCLPFVKSIKAANLVEPTRALLDQLLKKYQKAPYSLFAQSVAWELGLKCLDEALRKLLREYRGSTAVIHDMIKLISTDHIATIIDALEGIEKKDEMKLEATDQLCLDVVEKLLALDIMCLTQNRDTIMRNRPLQDDVNLAGSNIWDLAMQNIKPGHPSFAAALLGGVAGILPLEPFTTRQIEGAEKQDKNSKAGAWNNALQKTCESVQTNLLERLEEFSPQQITDLFMEPKGAKGLISLLFSGEPTIHQSSLSIIKILSGQDNRRDSLMHLIEVFLATTLSAIAEAQKVISIAGVFTPCNIMLKLTSDIFSCLTDSQDGVLRVKTLTNDQDIRAVKNFWGSTWTALTTIFEKMEPWSNLGYDKQAGQDKQMMMDFCRATMDFADYTFDQYSIVSNTLQGGDKNDASDVRKALLRYPSNAFIKIAKWLRLRDEYLISKAVNLTSKILVRLQEVGIEIDPAAAQYVEDAIVTGARVKTKLSMNQKAEIQRALEKHLGEKLADATDSDAPVPKKQGTLHGWANSGTASTMSSMTTSTRPRPGTIDVNAWASASDKAKIKREAEGDYKDLLKSNSSASESWKQMQPKRAAPPKPIVDNKSFLLKRRQEKEASDKRKAEWLAKQKGVGAGSGVEGLGDMGKDHTLKGQNVMVSSDEDSDDDDDDDLALFGAKVKEKRKIQRPNVDPNGAIGMRPDVKKGPTRIQRTQRSLKDMRARLAPDLSVLHKVILQWDFFHDGDYPPGANTHIFRAVSNKYMDPTSYQETFEPLLTLEAWQGMIRAREENTSKSYEVKIQNRSNVDNFLEVSSLVTQAENRDLGLSEGDIILLSKSNKPMSSPDSPHCLARIYRVKRQKQNLELVYQVMPGQPLASSLTNNAVAHGIKVQSITPLEREYGALQGLQFYDLCQQIVRAAPSMRIKFSEKQIAAYQDIYNVNRAQSEAINAALENEGFSLIQGPPGSGKTKTIVAIVGGLLSNTLGSAANTATKINMPKPLGGAPGPQGGRNNDSGDAPAKKLLVCAPSNAAVDELVMRLKQGVKTKSGRHYPLNVVRIGRSEAINQQVVDVTMEELVQKRLGGNTANEQQMRAKHGEVFKEHSEVSARLRELYSKRDSGEVKGKDLTELEAELTGVRKRKNELGVRIDNAKDNERNAGREAEVSRKRAQQAVLDNAHVICATLSGSGHDMFRTLNIEFETVIIDEAAQCVEMSSLIPLKYGCIKCIMVGDPKQLPPTVFSKEAAKFQYEQSLFVRMQNNSPDEVHLLDTQYRMHPDISLFPSRTFYDGMLKDGANMAALRQQPWHSSALLAPYRFFDVKGQHQTAKTGHSLVNHTEIEVAMALFSRLTMDFKTYDFQGRVGIITPYKSQLRELKATFSRRYGNEIFDTVEFNTTDAFQGRESEVIIFSCVRASPAGGIGFLQDIRRMNVGLTRAKSSLWVLGNSDSLVRGQYWKKLVDDARARDCYTTGNVMGMLRQPSSDFPASNTTTHSMLDVAPHVPQNNGNKEEVSPAVVRRPSEPQVQSSKSAPVPSTTVSKPADPPATERMEGITYRFQDRVAGKKRSADADTGNERASSHVEKRMNTNEDVEMEDAESVSGRSATPHSGTVPSLDGTRSRSETPLRGQGNGEEKVKKEAVKNEGSSARPPKPPAQPTIMKRPAQKPSMFISKKKKGPPGR